jgi:prolycopene isomerase
MGIRIPTLADPALAPPGEHIVSTVVPMPFDIGVPWREARERYTEMVLDQIEAHLPGYRAGLIFAEGSTPLALHRYSLALNGAMYGWENNPTQTQSRRPGHRTPIEGLYLSGAWTQPGSGANNCMQSGLQTAQIVLGATDQDQFLRDLAASNR